MGQVLHGGATTTQAIRRAIQNSQESLRARAKRYGINQKIATKWRQRETVADLPTGPKEAKSTVPSIEEEAIIVAFWRHTLLPLDDCLYALQPTIPHLTRSSLHRCLQRHGISRLPEVEGSNDSKKNSRLMENARVTLPGQLPVNAFGSFCRGSTRMVTYFCSPIADARNWMSMRSQYTVRTGSCASVPDATPGYSAARHV
jgi:hypothetical protein